MKGQTKVRIALGICAFAAFAGMFYACSSQRQRGPQSARVPSRIVAGEWRPEDPMEAERKLGAPLGRVDFEAATLEEVVTWLRFKADLNIVVDDNVRLDTPVTVHAVETNAREMLDRLAAASDRWWTARENYVFISDKEGLQPLGGSDGEMVRAAGQAGVSGVETRSEEIGRRLVFDSAALAYPENWLEKMEGKPASSSARGVITKAAEMELRSLGYLGEPSAARRSFGDYLSPAPAAFGGSDAAQAAAAGAISDPFAVDEVWVIVKPTGEAPPDDRPGMGSLMAKLPGKEEQVPVPLKHTDVKAAVAGYIATVDVTQQYENPFETKIEAVYVFPLPENAAVNEFLMVVGERRIRGIIKEREEAEKVYEEAKAQGYVASLLTQERPNVFTQSVANIEPGKGIDISIKYFSTLAYADGWYEFVFPMVVGPRYNPAGSTDGVGAVARGKERLSGQKTEVQYLAPGERSGHDIGLAVDIDAGVVIEEVASRNHEVLVKRDRPETASVLLKAEDAIPNKDFVLRYRVAGKTLKSGVLTCRDERGGFFTLMLFPPADLESLQRAPMEMVFVLDCSGSMSGEPIAQAKAAIRHALQKMRLDDSFQLISFSISASQLGAAPLEATPENIAKGLKYLDTLEGAGGTEMIQGIKAALDFPHDPKRIRTVAFLTDGYIGNEAQIFTETYKRLGPTRIFSFGVGQSVNRYLLDGLATMGKGAVAYLSLNDDAASVMDAYFERISHPALTDIRIDWGPMNVSDVYPTRIPDLFVGRPVIVTGRFDKSGMITMLGRSSTVVVNGMAGGSPRSIAVPVNLDTAEGHKGLPPVWARMRIADLSYSMLKEGDKRLADEIKDVALEFCLMSDYTAFVAVDSLAKTAGGEAKTVQVPVEVPEGVKYDTTVATGEGQEKGEAAQR
jgi:Ca-activated chloride channel family protein